MLQLIDPRPSTLWPLGFLAGLDDGQAAFDCLTLYFEAGAYHLGTQDQSDEDLENTGSVLGHLRAFPGFVLGFDPSAPRLGLPRYFADVDDPDGELAAILTGETAKTGVLRVAAVARIGAEGQSANDWPVAWTGVLVDWLSLDANAVRLVLAQDEGSLTSPVLGDSIDSRFPYARADAREQPVPRAVGSFDSRASGTPGAVGCLYVDTRDSEWRFLVVEGWAADVPRVYKDGVLQEEGTDYDVLHDTVRGLQGTWIQFLADPTADVDVRCDLVGLESVGNGTGTPWHTPALQLREMVDEADILDEETLAEVDDFLTANRRRPRLVGSTNAWTQGRRPSCMVTSAALRKIDLINQWCEAFGVYPYWNEAGKVAFAKIDHRDPVRYHDGFHWVRDEDLFGPPTQYGLRPRPLNRVSSSGLTAVDLLSPFEGAETVPNPWAQERISEAEMVPFATTDDDGYTFTGGTDFPDTVEQGPWTPDTIYASWAAGTGVFRVQARLTVDGPQIPQADAIQLLEVHFRAKGAGTFQAGVWVGGAAFYDGSPIAMTGSWADYVATFAVNPDTLAAWLVSEIGPDALELIGSAVGAVNVRAVRARVYTLDGGPASGLVREALARKLNLYSRGAAMTELKVRLGRAAIRPGDAFSVSTPQTVAPGAEGWPVETWNRRRHVMCSRTLRTSEKAAVLCAMDGHMLQASIWEQGKAEGLAPTARGIVRMGGWPAGLAREADGRQFRRNTDVSGDPFGQDSITAPWGSAETIEADHERYTNVGLELLPAAGAGPTIAYDRLRYLWLHDYQTWPIAGGTAFVLLSRTVSGTNILSIGSELVIIDGDLLIFRRSVDGTDYDASIDLAAEGFTTGLMAIAIQWTPGEGGLVRDDEDENEEDVPPYTLNVWARQGVATVTGTPVVAVEGFPADDWLDIGSQAGSGPGHVYREWFATPQLLTDDEVKAILEMLLP